MLIQLLFQNPLVFLFLVVALVFSISFHECAHAFMAAKLGDSTAKLMGRITLDPRAHLDPVGTVLLLIAGFGWGKPVPFNPNNLHNPKRDAALIAAAGPASNFLVAIASALLISLAGPSSLLGGFLYLVVLYNLVLGFFNLIPINPLDGFKIVLGFLSDDLSWQWLQMAPYGTYILFFLVFTRTTSRVLEPLLTISMSLLGLHY